jgi:hypothetical protein
MDTRGSLREPPPAHPRKGAKWPPNPPSSSSTAHGVGLAAAAPDLHVGVVSLRSDAALDQVLEALRPLAVARIGLSPPYATLQRTPQALHLARIALASAARLGRAHRVRRAPLPALVVSSPTTSYQVIEQVFGPLPGLPAAERETLLATL